MTISMSDSIQAIRAYDIWRADRVQAGESYSTEDYEAELLAGRNETRLRTIRGIAASAAENDSPVALLTKLQQIEQLARPDEETE